MFFCKNKDNTLVDNYKDITHRFFTDFIFNSVFFDCHSFFVQKKSR